MAKEEWTEQEKVERQRVAFVKAQARDLREQELARREALRAAQAALPKPTAPVLVGS